MLLWLCVCLFPTVSCFILIGDVCWFTTEQRLSPSTCNRLSLVRLFWFTQANEFLFSLPFVRFISQPNGGFLSSCLCSFCITRTNNWFFSFFFWLIHSNKWLTFFLSFYSLQIKALWTTCLERYIFSQLFIFDPLIRKKHVTLIIMSLQLSLRLISFLAFIALQCYFPFIRFASRRNDRTTKKSGFRKRNIGNDSDL